MLMTHVYYGDPSPEFSDLQIQTLVDAGADIIELGIPFSDPTADGPVFQRACQRALDGGMTPERVLEQIPRIDAKVVVTTYYNIILKMGAERFLDKAQGAYGIIVPNLPLEESEELEQLCKERGIHFIHLIAPTTTDQRLDQILARASGFLYIVSVSGVTGARDKVPDSTLELICKVKQRSDLPALVGFGISKPSHVEQISTAGADGAIVGSAIARLYEGCLDTPQDALKDIAAFISSMSISHNTVTKIYAAHGNCTSTLDEII